MEKEKGGATRDKTDPAGNNEEHREVPPLGKCRRLDVVVRD